MIKRLFIELSGDCVGKCPGCFSIQKGKFDIGIYTDILKDGIDEGFNWVGLCGRDAFQHYNSKEIVCTALDLGYSVRVYSCLLSNNSEPQNFKTNFSKLDITFIVWGLPDIHDSHCGINGAFIDSCQKILTWKQAGARIAAKYFPNQKSRDNIDELKKIFYGLGIPLLICVWWTPLDFHLFRKDFKPLLANKAIKIMKAQNIFQKYSHDIQSPPCKAGWQRVFISSDFLLKACNVTEKFIADLTKVRFTDIWRQDTNWGKWRSIRLKDMQECMNCQYQEYCHICPSSFIEYDQSVCNHKKKKWARSIYESKIY